jgi:glutaredoxin
MWRYLMIFLLLFCGPAAMAAGDGAAATTPLVTIHYFRADGCPHCDQASEFLKRYAGDARIRILEYEARHNAANRERFIKVADALGVKDGGVPFILIGDWAVMGYLDERWTGGAIATQVARCLDYTCPDNVSAILAGTPPPTPIQFTRAGAGLPETVRLPLIGEIGTAALSLPALTIVLGAIDGFNPCAMWALVFLLGLLMGSKDRRRMWILGLTFLFGSGLVYFLIMAAWLNVLLIIGFSVWIRMTVGVVALGAAAYYLHDFISNPDAACEVSHSGGRQQMLARLRRFALEERLWPAMAGVLLLAIAVNMIELVCSAGIPAIYTQLLTLTPMPRWQYYGYLLLYNLVYMLDDIAMFAVAVATLQMTGLGARFARASRLIGGVVLAAIGLMLLFRPQWLSFSG